MKLLFNKYLFSSLILIFFFLGVWVLAPDSTPDFPVISQKLKGVCWVGSRQALQGGELESLATTGANSISQTPFGWQADPGKPEIRWALENDRMWWGESAIGLKTTLDSAKSHQISSMLKPHLWVRGAWPGEVEMSSEQDWQQWFGLYRKFIVDYARLAEKSEMPFFCIGTELEKTSHRTQDWRKIISAVREVYSGKITYAANFTEYEQIQFWSELDFIGIQGYFPLSEKKKPTKRELINAWKTPISNIEAVVNQFQKPVIFTEIGYCNTEDAAKEPWVWPNERHASKLSESSQALCYEAFFDAVWTKEWLAGVYFWKWYPEGKGRDPDFSPQGLQAEKVMRTYFSQP
ncbi:hypothetical protein [Algoriphagus sp.]|uniref:glycoside hydrolase family 113 n=1 Tax=Algoriphagus sp. TaxID=1872435 RepID=UPI002614D3C9|nr:hypothetical protein [Algoriphagus sp.]